MQSNYCKSEYVKTNMGLMPLEDYYDIQARQMGFDSYEDLRDNGYSIDKPETVMMEEDGNELYLIKSINWTRHYKKDTYWAPNECGYVSIIANAGFYKESQAKEIVARSSGNAEMIPVTKELLQEAIRQLDKRVEELTSAKEYEQRRHESTLEDLTKKSDAVDAGYVLLDEIADNLGIAIKDDEIEKGM